MQNRPRPALFCSDILFMNDHNFPMHAVLVYMALTATPPNTDHDLAKRLGTMAPSSPKTLPDIPPIRLRSHAIQLEMV
jgi:hypothetical protein